MASRHAVVPHNTKEVLVVFRGADDELQNVTLQDPQLAGEFAKHRGDLQLSQGTAMKAVQDAEEEFAQAAKQLEKEYVKRANALAAKRDEKIKAALGQKEEEEKGHEKVKAKLDEKAFTIAERALANQKAANAALAK